MTLTHWHKQVLAFLLSLPTTFCYTVAVADTLPSGVAIVPAIASAPQLQAMDDDELAQATGQALLNMSYLAPGEAKDKNGALITNANNTGVGFYTLGLEGKLEINANIRKLQLGCGGINGAGGCDIDIDYFSLSGCGATTCTANSSPSRGERASSDAVLTNPFIQLAFKNPDSPTARELVGFRFGAQNANGMLTFGEENSSTPNGINSLSGYLSLTQAQGAGNILPINASFSCNQTNHPTTNCGVAINPVTMKLQTTVGVDTTTDCTVVTCTIATNTGMLGTLCVGATWTPNCSANTEGDTKYVSRDYILPLSAAGTTTYPVTGGACPANKVCFTTNPAIASGTRMTSVNLTGAANVPTIAFDCSTYCAFANTSFLGVDLDAKILGSMSGLSANAIISESLGMFHKMAINSPFSMSVQGQQVFWPGAAAAANRGWWMAFDDPVDPGNVSPQKQLAFDASVLQQAFCGPNNTVAGGGCSGGNSYTDGGVTYRTGATGSVNDSLWYMRGGAINVNGIVAIVVKPTINVGNIPVTSVVNYPMNDLQLAAQAFEPNCWGSLKFC